MHRFTRRQWLPGSAGALWAQSRPPGVLVDTHIHLFAADRILWGGPGMESRQFARQTALFEEMFAFASETGRAKIRALNAVRLFSFSTTQA